MFEIHVLIIKCPRIFLLGLSREMKINIYNGIFNGNLVIVIHCVVLLLFLNLPLAVIQPFFSSHDNARNPDGKFC